MAFSVDFGTFWKHWVKALTEQERAQVARRLTELSTVFGNPHEHSGLGIRRVGRHLFEFRISRASRVVFAFPRAGTIPLLMVGDHDEVAAWLKHNAR